MPHDPDAPRRISHDELVAMLRSDQVCEDVIELTDEEVDDATSRPEAGGTMRSPARTPSPGRPSQHVQIVEPSLDGESSRSEGPMSSAAPDAEPDDEVVAASARNVIQLREALGEKEMEVLSLRSELLQKERELALVRARRSIAPLARFADQDQPASSIGPRLLRFIAGALERSVSGRWRSAADFVRHFPPQMVMRQLDHHPAVRASFLTLLVGIPERTALRTPTEDAGRLLQTTVEEHDCEPESFMRVFHRTAASGYLEPVQAWSFITGDDLSEVCRNGADDRYPIARAHVADLLDLGMAHRLLSPADVIDGITIEVLAESLGSDQLSAALRDILDAGRRGEPFTDADLLGGLPSVLLVEQVPLERILEGVLLPLERRSGFGPL